MKTHPFFVIGTLALSLSLHCAGARVGGEPISSNGGDQAVGGGGGGGGGSKTGGGGGGLKIDLDAAPNLTPPDTRPGDPPPNTDGCVQDDAGNYNCCPEPMSIISFGQVGATGMLSGKDDVMAFQAFMNSNTGGTAKMDAIKKYTPLTADFLSKYNLVILQDLGDSVYTAGGWSYTQSDVDALHTWVTEKGGAVISMSGYTANSSEVTPTNLLLAPFGISYNEDDTFTEGNCTDNLCYCSYGSIPFDGWLSDTDDLKQIAVNHDDTPLGKVGNFRGRSINCEGSDCQILAKNAAGKTVGVIKRAGKGRVFAWNDEWVTYTSQWGLTPDMGPPGQGFDDKVKYAQCVGHTPSTSYKVPQFWYNVLRWLVPGATCFTIVIPPTAPEGQQPIL